MDAIRRVSLLALALAITLARAHQSHDNILRIQLWDAEGLSREPRRPPISSSIQSTRKTLVDLDTLYSAMLDENGNDIERYTRHKVRHKRRRGPRDTYKPWRFHDGEENLNVQLYDEDVPITIDEEVLKSEVSDNEHRDVSPPMTLRQEADEVEEVKAAAVVPKCCPSGQNLSSTRLDNGSRVCSPTTLSFVPEFYRGNDSFIWGFETNLFETLVGNPCTDQIFLLNPDNMSDAEFYLLDNGSLFAPFQEVTLMGVKDYCMESFWNESDPYGAGMTLPVVCFRAPESVAVAGTVILLIFYAIGMLISVPFLLATAAVYLLIREMRDTQGKALACHALCLATSFSCRAAIQLAGHAFPGPVCTVMAYTIQFSFVSSFFWLNIMVFDTYWNVRCYTKVNMSRRNMRRRFAWYATYAVVLPLVLMIVTIIMDLAPAVPSSYLKPNFGANGCWFHTDKGALPYFYGPVAVIMLANVIIFFLTSRAIAKQYNQLKDFTVVELTHSEFSTTDDWVRLGAVLGEQLPAHERSPAPDRPNMSERIATYRKIFRNGCVLTAIMGLSMMMEVVSWAADVDGGGWNMFDLITAPQGVVIFCIYVLQQPARSKVKISLSRWFKRRNDPELVVSERTSIDCGTGKRDYV